MFLSIPVKAIAASNGIHFIIIIQDLEHFFQLI